MTYSEVGSRNVLSNTVATSHIWLSNIRNVASWQDMETAHMSIDRRMDKKIWYMHTMEYYSTSKNKEILTFMTTWMNLDDTMLNEISQLQDR